MRVFKKNLFKSSLFFSLLFIFSCNAYKEVEIVDTKKYDIGNITNQTVDLGLTVRINNPNNYNIKIKQTTLDLYVEGGKEGEVEMKEDITILKNTDKEYTLYVVANYKELSNSFLSVFQKNMFKSSIKLGVKGKVKAKAYGLVGKKFDLDLEETVNLKELMKMIKI
jgi:LEA14-like dessication related protein